MRSHADFATYCTELLATAGQVHSKRMFGGYGLYVDDVFVAILIDDVLYLKADEKIRPRFEAAGGRRFEYVRQGRKQGLGFWTVPDEAMDSPALMRPWVQLALGAALRARTSPRGAEKP
jgi:DNA transformation protein and related proteins